MDADLCRKLALVTGSPLFRHQIAKEEDAEATRQTLIDACVQSVTESNLPDGIKALFSKCEASIAEAERLKIPYPYDQPGQLERIMGLDKVGGDNAN